MTSPHHRRDGQKRRVHIYRLLTTGTIDEKIFQRQVAKQGLGIAIDTTKTKKTGSAAASAGSGSSEFSTEDLKDLFKLHPDTLSDTHDLLACDCGEDDGATGTAGGGGGGTADSAVLKSMKPSTTSASKKKAKAVDALMSWSHLCDGTDLDDGLLQSVSPTTAISFVMHKQTNMATPAADATPSPQTTTAASAAGSHSPGNLKPKRKRETRIIESSDEEDDGGGGGGQEHGHADPAGGQETEEEVVDLLSVFSDSD
jgi:hypothetical protein